MALHRQDHAAAARGARSFRRAREARDTGQEFNLVIEGTVVVTWADKEFELNAGDSIYFNPEHPHGQRCGSDVPAKFVTIIAE
ncbi:MAG: cupin domain-containing protein [Adlercreutzia sp.]